MVATPKQLEQGGQGQSRPSGCLAINITLDPGVLLEISHSHRPSPIAHRPSLIFSGHFLALAEHIRNPQLVQCYSRCILT